MNKELNLPVFNYKNEFSVRQVQPISLEYKHSDYHGECWHLSGYDFNKESIRDFEFDKVVRGVIHFTLETLGENSHDSKVDGIMNKLKENIDANT